MTFGRRVPSGHLDTAPRRRQGSLVIGYAVVDDSLPACSIWAVMEVCVRREDAERFIEEVRGDDPGVATLLRIEERGARGGRADLGPAWRLVTLDRPN